MACLSHFITRSAVTSVLVAILTIAAALNARAQDTTGAGSTDTLKYPIHDRYGDRYSNPGRRSLDLNTPANISDSIVYDPKTKQYYIIEKIGDFYYRKPTYLTFEEMMRIQSRKYEDDYFRKRANILSGLNRKLLRPKMSLTDNLFNRIFGNGKIEIRPQGEVNIIAGYQGQNIKNPALPERARKNGGFDFDMNANLSVIGNIGDKLKLPINYNTLANFDFENQLKLDYTGTDDEIIKRIEAGNVSFSSKGSLIPGAQGLFGLKTSLQFGKLTVTGVLANQRSQRQSLGIQGGASTSSFEFKANDYEENRHFLLAQYFREHYNEAMSRLPIVTSQVQILRIEVWVTNRNGSTTETRDVVGLMDLGECPIYNTAAINCNPSPNGQALPNNLANDLYTRLLNTAGSRDPSQVTSRLMAMGLRPVQDFEKTFARKLNPGDFYYNPQIGFISLNQPLQPDEVLGVAFQYSYNGRVYQVGEFSQDIPPDTTTTKSGTQKVLFLKLLKATSQRTNLPLWDLMMKNVYALKTRDGSYLPSVQPDNFQLNVLYEEPSLGQKRFLPEGSRPGVPLITILNLDRLNKRNDPAPDGIFDYLEGYTIVSQQGRIIFPLLEPFGRDLDSLAFDGQPQDLKDKYIYYPLYDTIKEIAKTYANLDRYVISGYAKTQGSSSSEIMLGAFNVPPGSVIVTAGGQTLVENVDYTVDYNLGSVRIINQAILNAGLPVNVQFENNAGFGMQQRNFLGLRLDYLAKATAKESLSIGASMVRLGERPFFTKTGYNEDPIRNTMYGVDFSYMTQSPRLTRWLDKLPFYNTTEMSTITAYGEAAFLKPGHPPQIGKGGSGLIFIDDFEGSRNAIDLRFPLVSWGLASTPGGDGSTLFPEWDLRDNLQYGYNRAKLAWYNIEPVLQDPRSTNNPITNDALLKDPRVRSVKVTEIFRNRTPDFGQANLVTFDLAYYPTERGPYNFDTNVNPDGTLPNPQNRWGGIMRGIDQVDFETGNVEFIEFWLQDPFLTNPSSSGGQLYFNLGNVSEDVLKDGKRFFENGISGAVTQAQEDSSTVWGKVPANPIQVTQAFSNDPSDRPLQDAGFDGLTTDAENRKFQAFLNQMQGILTPEAFARLRNDPSSDNYINYRDGRFGGNDGILARYKNINNPEGNSPVASADQEFVSAFTLYPDQEEFNRDNTLNELEEYFQYRVDLTPAALTPGTNYITDSIAFTPSGGQQEKWYLFRIPIAEYEQKIGNIPDFKSIRFIRLFLTGFSDSVVLRFAKLELVRNTWRRFNYELDTTGQQRLIPANSPTTVNQLAVNIEENASRKPVPYKTPPGVVRQQQLSNNNVNLLLNEQSLSLQICNLAEKDARGVFKTMNLDLRQYNNLQMYFHAESVKFDGDIKDNELYGVIRLGNDMLFNFYEIKIPLAVTRWGIGVPEAEIWPLQNELSVALDRLTKLKLDRNLSSLPSTYFRQVDGDGREFAILGNPNLGEVRVMFIGVENRSRPEACTEVWFNELRLNGLDEKGGYAAMGRVDFKLADLGTVYVSGSVKSAGFGTIEQRVNERSREDFTQFDVATTLELGKLLPQKAGISIPFYGSYSRTVTTPEYDPYDLDIKLKDKLAAATGDERDSIRNDAVDVKTIKTFNFTNVKKMNTSGKKPQLWSIENFDVSYSYYKEEQHNPLIENNSLVRHRAGLGYNYTNTPKYWEPAKKLIKSRSPWFALIKDFNLNPVPALLGFRADVNRQFGAFRPRSVGTPKGLIPETYDKFFTFDRYYNLRWDLTRSFNVDFTAVNRAWVDEDTGRLDDNERKRVWENFWKGGRNIAYNQKANFTYTLPTSKFPLLDWTTIRASYVATYDWLAASMIARSLGNSLSNSQVKSLNAELNFDRLYSKWRLLRSLDDAPQPPQPPAPSTDTTGKKKKRDRSQPAQLGGLAKFGLRILTSIKQMSVQYSENASATIYGYTDSTQALGMNWRSRAPGLGFIFGKQPDTSFINYMGQKGWLTSDSLFNYQNRQDYQQRLSITAQLMPVRDLTIDLNLDKTFGKTYSELYKDTTGTGQHFARLNPYASGSFSISYISFQTLFEKIKPNEVSETFQKFQDYRIILSKRLAESNPYWADLPASEKFLPDGFYNGYSRYAQDVLLPAFIAAYTGKDPLSVALLKQSNPNMRSNPFSGYIPKPNWRITYTGLTRIPGLEKIFTNFSISHAYNGSLGMNSFNSALLFQDPFGFGYPKFIDTVSDNFIPYFLVPNITISEQFAPLIDLDMQFTNQVQARFEFRKTRTLALSLIDFQLSENRSTEFTIGAGYRQRGLFSWIKWKGKPLENDASFRLDFGIRDDVTSNSRLDQTQALPTSGQKVVTINPSIDYVISNRVNIKLYFEQRRVEPKISTSPPITNTRAGVQVRISLAQ